MTSIRQARPVADLREITWGFREGTSDRLVLNRVSLTLFSGEWVSITGPSGSGKSTLLNIVAGIEVPTDGEVHINGECLSNLSEHECTLIRRKHIGFIFQFFNLVPTLTVLENLMLPLQLTSQRADSEIVQQRLNRLGLADRSNSFPDVLSGGEQQRVAAVRASIHKPMLILADEPTGNLDQEAGNKVLDVMEELVDNGISIIMVTHSDSASSRAHQRYELTDGQLAPLR
ncbi:MAG: ABC transporter ATP-binding protein [Pseudomonadota bacterium]